MNRKLKQSKLEFFYLRKAFFKYHQLFNYIKIKYFIAPRILKSDQVFEKPINHPDLTVHILTCHRDLIMTLWSLRSFYKTMDIIGELCIHSDGSLTNDDKYILHKFFPSSQIIEPKYFIKKYAYKLKQYPTISNFRINCPQYFLLKKLIDPYFVSSKNLHLVIDSDLMWFKKPIELEQAIRENAINSYVMSNNDYSYIYFKDNSKLDDQLASYNTGVVLYHKDNFNLDKISEYLNKIDTTNIENKHFIEQAGYTYALENIICLPREKYIIAQDVNSQTIMRHYTSPRRPLFYIEAIKKYE